MRSRVRNCVAALLRNAHPTEDPKSMTALIEDLRKGRATRVKVPYSDVAGTTRKGRGSALPSRRSRIC